MSLFLLPGEGQMAKGNTSSGPSFPASPVVSGVGIKIIADVL
jgi:hypothetical protein